MTTNLAVWSWQAWSRLYWLLPLLLLWAMAMRWWLWRERQAGCSRMLEFSLSPYLPALAAPPGWRWWWRERLHWLRLLVLLLLMVAGLRPQRLLPLHNQRVQGISIMLVIDTSQSMMALDLDAHKAIEARRHRLAVVKDVVHEFIGQRQQDEIGSVVFGSEAYSQCPLTLDHDLLRHLLTQIEPGMIGEATAIGLGLAIGVKRLQKAHGRSKVIILLTDGSNNAGPIGPLPAAQLAASQGIKVYTIGVGSRGKAPFLVNTVFGKQVQYMSADLDEKSLQTIASNTGGAYFRAEQASSLRSIYQRIDALEKAPLPQKRPHLSEEYYHRWITVALLVWGLEWAMLHLVWPKIP